MKKRIGQNDGMSLIEVVVALGVMTAMMMGFMSMINNQSKATSYLEDKLSRVSLETELRMQFTNPDYCTNLFKGVPAALKNQNRGDVLGLIKTPSQIETLRKVFVQKNNKIDYDQLELHQVALDNSTVTGPNSSGTMDIVFYPNRRRTGGGPVSLQPIKIKSQVQVDGSSNIISCQPEDSPSGKSCLLADIFKTNGCPIPSSAPIKGKFFRKTVTLPPPSYKIDWMDQSTVKGTNKSSIQMTSQGDHYGFSTSNITIDSGSGIIIETAHRSKTVQTQAAQTWTEGCQTNCNAPAKYQTSTATYVSPALCSNGKWVFLGQNYTLGGSP